MRTEREIMGELVFAAEKARQHEEAGGRRTDAEKIAGWSEIAVDREVIERTHQDRDAEDRQRVGDHAQHAHGVTRKRYPAARRTRARE